jgi:hypothetical protein
MDNLSAGTIPLLLMKEENVPLDCPASLSAIRLTIPTTHPTIPISSKKVDAFASESLDALLPESLDDLRRNGWMTSIGISG